MKLLLVIGIIFSVAAAQAALPPLAWLGGLRIEFLPAVVAWAALSVPSPSRAILIAVLAGLAQDALSAAPFGLSAIGYGVPAVALCAIRGVLDRDLPWVQAGAGGVVAVFGALLASIAAGFFPGAPAKVLLLGIMNGVVTLLLAFVAGLAGLRPAVTD